MAQRQRRAAQGICPVCKSFRYPLYARNADDVMAEHLLVCTASNSDISAKDTRPQTDTISHNQSMSVADLVIQSLAKPKGKNTKSPKATPAAVDPSHCLVEESDISIQSEKHSVQFTPELESQQDSEEQLDKDDDEATLESVLSNLNNGNSFVASRDDHQGYSLASSPRHKTAARAKDQFMCPECERTFKNYSDPEKMAQVLTNHMLKCTGKQSQEKAERVAQQGPKRLRVLPPKSKIKRSAGIAFKGSKSTQAEATKSSNVPTWSKFSGKRKKLAETASLASSLSTKKRNKTTDTASLASSFSGGHSEGHLRNRSWWKRGHTITPRREKISIPFCLEDWIVTASPATYEPIVRASKRAQIRSGAKDVLRLACPQCHKVFSSKNMISEQPLRLHFEKCTQKAFEEGSLIVGASMQNSEGLTPFFLLDEHSVSAARASDASQRQDRLSVEERAQQAAAYAVRASDLQTLMYGEPKRALAEMILEDD